MARKIEIEIVGDVSGLSRAFSKAAGDTDSFGSRVGKLGTSIAKMGALAGVAIGAAALGGLALTIRAGITEFAEAAKVGAQTNAVLESTAGIANVTAKQVSALAESLMRKSGVDDEAIQSGENMLLTFTKVRNEVGAGNDIFNQGTTAALNLSVAMGKDMPAAAMLVGKALNDPIKGMTALTKAGIQFTDAQKTAIKAMVESGDVMGAQKIILKELNTQFGGSAEALGKTLPGQINILKQSFSNLAGEIVGKLAPAFAKAVTEVTGFVSKLSAAKGMEAKVKVVFEGLQQLGTEAIKIGLDVGKQLTGALGNVNWTAAATSIAKAIGAALKTGIPAAMDLASTFTKGLLAAVDAIDWAMVGREIGIGLKEGIKKGAVSWVKGGMMDMLKAGATPNSIVAKAVGEDLGKAFTDRFGKSTEDGMLKLPSVVERGLGALSMSGTAPASSGGRQIGASFALGMASGIAANAQAAAIQAALMVNHAYSSASTAAQMHSPSQLFAKIGEGTVQGYILGITTKMPELKGKMAEAISAALDAAREVVSKYQSVLGDAFGKVGEYVGRQFAAKTEAELEKIALKFDRQIARITARAEAATPAERELAGIAKSEDERNRERAKTEAEAALVAAQAMEEGVEKERAVAAAKEQIRRADLDNRVAGLEAQAVVERAAAEKQAAEQIAKLEAAKARELQNYEERRAQMEASLDKQLAALGARLAKHPEEYDKIQKQIQKLLASYGIPMQKAGENLGKAFAQGIRDSIDDAVAAAKALAKAVSKYLPHSPAEKGPLAKPIDWSGYLTSGLPGGGSLAAAASRMAGGMVAGPSMAMAGAGGGRSGGGGTVNNFHFPNYTGDKRELIQMIRTETQRASARN